VRFARRPLRVSPNRLPGRWRSVRLTFCHQHDGGSGQPAGLLHADLLIGAPNPVVGMAWPDREIRRYGSALTQGRHCGRLTSCDRYGIAGMLHRAGDSPCVDGVAGRVGGLDFGRVIARGEAAAKTAPTGRTARAHWLRRSACRKAAGARSGQERQRLGRRSRHHGLRLPCG
jgi:hypothetical protein